MGQDKAVEKYDYIRRVDAICDLITGVLATGAQTPEELGEHLPGLLQMVPEYHASLVPKVYPDLIEALLTPKNRNIGTFILAFKEYLTDLTNHMDEGRPLVSFFPFFSPEIFFAMGLVPLMSEALPFIIAIVLSDGVNSELDEAERDGLPGHVCGFQKAPLKGDRAWLFPQAGPLHHQHRAL